MKKTISFIFPALNEQELLVSSINSGIEAARILDFEYEIIVVDDGSSDATLSVAEKFRSENQNTKVVTHNKNLGLGAAYKSGLKVASKEYVMLLPADNAWDSKSIEGILKLVGSSDIVIPYIKNAADKSLFRRMLSGSYTKILNFVFGLKVPYYNGIVVHKRHILNTIEIVATDFSYQTEALVKLLRMGSSYVVVEANTNKRDCGKSKALSLNNIYKVCLSNLKLYFVIAGNEKYKRRN